MRQFASKSLALNDETEGGKAGLTPAPRFALEAGQTGQAESFAPLADDLARSAEAGGDDIIGKTLSSQEDDLGAGEHRNTVTYIDAPRIPNAAVRLGTTGP